MLHVFKALGAMIAMDVDSGSVHMVDEPAYEVLSRIETMEPDAIVAELKDRFDENDLREIIDEIDQMKQAGQLLTNYDYTGLEIKTAGTVKAMCLHAAHDCNLRCKYCFADGGDYHGQHRMLLPYDVGVKALDWLIAHSGNRHNLEVDFFGGEPLMNFEVVKRLVEYGRKREKEAGKHFNFTITTNCVALTDDKMEFINKEMKNIVLSLDGRKSVHDFMRPTANGKPSYDIIMPNALKMAKMRGDKEYYVRGTYTAMNPDFSKDVIALNDAGFEQISVEPVVLTPDSPYALRPDQLPMLKEQYEELGQEYIRRRAAGHFINFFHFNVDLEGGPCIRKRLSGCGSGDEYVAVTPEGDIYPCHQFVGREGYKMGSVLDGSFDTTIQKRFAANHVLNKEKCRSCWARFYCSGGCAANAQLLNGDISKPYDMECELERKRLECAIAVYAIERENRLRAKEQEEK